MTMTRRAAMAALVVGATSPILAGAGPVPVRGGGIIDCHFHPMVPAIIDQLPAPEVTSPGDKPFVDLIRRWTAEEALAQMDANGIAFALQSIVPPYGLPADPGTAQTFVAAANEQAAAIAARYPGRFGTLAALSMTDTKATIAEIAHSLDVLGADGIGILTQYQRLRPGDPRFDEILGELDRRAAVVFIHPVLPQEPTPTVHGLAVAHTELAFEVTRTIASLLFNGSFRRFPRIRFIFTHGGAATAMLVERWEQMARHMPGMDRLIPDGVVAELARHYFDLATVAHPVPFAALAKMVPPSQILFGSDGPFLPITPSIDGLKGLPLSAAERRAIERGNAERLFPRFAGQNT